jgi:transposase
MMEKAMSKNKPAGKQKQSGREKVDWKALEIVHPQAAGIDVGGSEHWVAINPDLDAEPVRRFGCFTADLREMARWLVEKGVRSVAMQSTGVYWMPVFEILEQHNLEVFLVNARHTKNVPGRKSDIQECQWFWPQAGPHGLLILDKADRCVCASGHCTPSVC